MAELFTMGQSKISIKGLRLRTYIGIKEEEINNKQDIVIDIVIRYDASKAAESDSINSALNYRTITKKVISHVENGKFHLLEKLTKDVLNIAFEDNAVEYVQVEIQKPHALRFADSVSLSLEASR